jgi:carboxyl-terminal processing protease
MTSFHMGARRPGEGVSGNTAGDEVVEGKSSDVRGPKATPTRFAHEGKVRALRFSRKFQVRWARLGGLSTLLAAVHLAAACGSSAPGTIGAALGQRTDRRVFVRSVPPGEGADRAGLTVDDEILLIDGKEVSKMTPDEIRAAVRGDVGSTLVVTVLRGGERREIKVVRTPLLAAGTEGKAR